MNKFIRRFQSAVSFTTLIATLAWSLGISAFIPSVAYAAVTVTGPFELMPPEGMHLPVSGFDSPILKFALTQSAGETLSSVTVTLTTTSGTAGNHLANLSIFRDSNGNNFFDPQSDALAGTQSSVNIGSATTINTGSNNSLAAAGGLATSFFLTVKTAAGWAVPDSFKITMAANGIATSANSPTITAFTGANTADANVGGGGGAGGGFGVNKVSFVSPTTFDVSFTDLLDLNLGAATSTSNYTLTGTGASATTAVTVLPDNKSARVVASGATVVGTGTASMIVSANVKNQIGIANNTAVALPIFDSFQPLVISEIKAGAAADQYDEFVELYNRSGAAVGTSTIKLHLVNAAGTVDVNVPLTFMNGVNIPSNGFFLIAPTGSPASTTADAVYSTSSIRSIVPDGALYISNSTASSSAVIDRVCWGVHTSMSDCEGNPATALANDGKSIERKANNSSTAATMMAGDATNGNGNDAQNNTYDFVIKDVPVAQNSLSAAEVPGGGSWGGASNQAPFIQHAPIFNATASSTLSIMARMTDDGGALSASKAQLVFCTSNGTACTPNLTNPLYGTSIGSGWYKFSATTTVWSNNNTQFHYYLIATDSASPAKTKVFTNDPSFDAAFDNTQTGIATVNLQQSKALSINLSQGALGSTSISGTVNSNSGQAVAGATVWIEGSQFSATTGNDGTFSFTNVGPSGGKQIRVSKDGFADQASSIFIPPSGLVALPAITLYSGTMGVGGDFTAPKIISTSPIANSNSFSSQGPSGGAPQIIIGFSKAMDVTTFVTTTANSASAGMYLTTAGSQTKIMGSVTYNSITNLATFTPAAALTAGQGYTLYVTPAVKDTAGNPVAGNGPGGQYVLMFATAGQFFASFSDIGGGGTQFGMGSAFPPFIKGGMPNPGAQSVARNTKVFVTFSEAMQDTSGNRAKAALYSVINPFTASESKTAVNATSAFDTSGKFLIITPSSALSASTHYRLEVLGGITSAKGIPLGNPATANFATTILYKGDFDTASGSDSTAPTALNTVPTASATGVSTINPIIINFSEAMDPSTISGNSIAVKSGSTAIDGVLTYDPTSWIAKFSPTYGLSPTSTYTLDITTDVKDMAGNALGTELLRAFTTGSADTTAPTMLSAQGTDFSFKVIYSKPMLSVPNGDLNYANSVLNSSNYLIKKVSTAGVALETVSLPPSATLTYDPGTRSVSIDGFSTASFTTGFTAGATLLNVKASNVKDIGFNSIDTTANVATSTAQASTSGGLSGGGGLFQDASGNNIQGGQFGPPPTEFASFKSSGIGFVPSVHVLPFSTMAGVSTIYGVDAPISTQIPAGGAIDISFPDGTDVSQAKQDTNSPKNKDMNGPGTGTVVFGTSEGTLPSGWTTGGASNDGVIVNTAGNKVRVILGSVATRSESSDTHDFLKFDLAQITNPSVVTSVGTAGNTATVETKKADGTVIETLTSGSFFTTQAGSLTLRGQVLSGATGLNGVNVFLFSPGSGSMSSTTAASRWGSANGEFLFQNLSAGSYMLGIEQYFKISGTSYTASFPVPVNINAANCAGSVCTQNVSATNASSGATLTLSITGTYAAGGDAVDIFAGGPGAYRMTTTTLTGVLTNDTSNSLKLNANGVWTVGFGPSMSTEIFGKGASTIRPAWIVPKPQQVTVSGCPAACAVTPNTLTFSSQAANKTVKFTVKDASGNKLGQARVFAYSPGNGLGNDTTANADGTGSIALSNGTYKIAASIPGMPGGADHTISLRTVSAVDTVFVDGAATGFALSTMAASDLILVVSKPSYTISGKVTDGSNPVSGAPVGGFRSDGQGHADTFTNSSGEYTLYVTAGIWKVTAFLPQQYGALPPKTITITDANSSNQNFEPNTTSVNYATVTESVGIDLNSNGVFDGGEAASTTQVTVEGTTADGDHYLNTVLTDTNGSSTLKVPPGTYTMKAWSPSLGDLPAFGSSLVVNSAGTATTQPSDLLAPKTGTVSVNVLDTSGNATSTDKMVIEFEQIGGKIDSAAAFGNVSSTVFTLPIYDAGASNIALGNVTSTSPANFYLMKITAPGIPANLINVYGGGSTIMATSSIVSGLYKVEVDGSETINVRLPAINYVSGTVLDGNGTAVPDATVHMENKATGETIEVKADSSGNYSTKLATGTYLIQSEKDGYIDTAASFSVVGNGALAATATTMIAADLTITGTITVGGTAVSGAAVKGQKLGGGSASATTASDGTYTLRVPTGNWKVSAIADGYTEKSYANVVAVGASNVSSINISLSGTNTSLAGSTSLSVTPQTGGTLSDTTANVSINAAESAIASSANGYSLSEKEVSNVVGASAGKPIGGEAKSVTSYTNEGAEVTSLIKSVGITAGYSIGDLTASLGTLSTTTVEKVKMGSWDATADNWEHLPTTIGYKDSSGNFVEPNSTLSNVSTVSFTGQTTHFSSFNPIAPADGLAPSAPSSITATSGNAQVVITWVAPTTNSDGSAISDILGYEVYRSTSANGTYTQINTSDVSGTTYTDTTAANGSTYYYKVTTADTGGLESDLSSASGTAAPSAAAAVNATVGGSGGGGGAAPAPAPATLAPVAPVPAVVAPTAVVVSATNSSVTETVVAAAIVSNPDSAVAITLPPTASAIAGTAVKFSYRYANTGTKTQSIKITRELVNSKGKVVDRSNGTRKLKPAQAFENVVSQSVPKTLPAGEYTVRVRILSANNKVLEENSFALTVARPQPVKPAAAKQPPVKKAVKPVKAKK